MKRSSGILIPISSLPSPNGIGTLGKAAYDFIDFLAEAGQSWWQILPVGPTSVGDSPYQSPSAYAGNPYFVDLDLLIEDGLLTGREVHSVKWGGDPQKVDYGLLYEKRFRVLKKAMQRGWERDQDKIRKFEEENAFWVYDYAMFMALKKHFGMVSWQEWPDEEIRFRKASAMEKYRTELSEEIRFYIYVQYLFFLQWEKLKAYAHKKKIGIIGDIALYVALDSADVWASPENFQLDDQYMPKKVAGVPPDYFSEDGQLWGNPLYNYDYMRRDGYGWWIRRVGGAAKLYDVIRIDHFRGLESYWAVPFGEKTARNGRWVKGPGMDLVDRLRGWFRDTQFIAEDLGYPTPEVAQLLQDSGFPGMKVLEFAFDPEAESDYLPHNYSKNCVCYIGTHDNETLLGWKEATDQKTLKKACRYLGLHEEEGFVWGFIRGGMSSVADLFIVQMQDLLGLGAEARMNTPGTMAGNWQWRMLPDAVTPELTARIAEMTRLYGRSRKDV